MEYSGSRVHSLGVGCRLVALIGLLVGVACHSASRNNPLDPELTPGVTLQSVIADSLQGTATITWSQYVGDQPFASYRVDRRLSGETAVQTRATITDPGTTAFVDTGLVVDQTYVYTVYVINTAGLPVESKTEEEVSFTFEKPQILRWVFDSQTASATFTWSRAVSGFEYYEIQRETADGIGPLILGRLEGINDTTFTDEGLTGNTEYTYRVTTRSTTGRELQSDPVSGMFHRYLGGWGLSMAEGLSLKAVAAGPGGQVYAAVGNQVSLFLPQPKPPDEILTITDQGILSGQFASDPSPDLSLFEATDIAANENGIYVLLRGAWSTVEIPLPQSDGGGTPTPPSPPSIPLPKLQTSPSFQPGSESETVTRDVRASYINAFDLNGNLLFRFPDAGSVYNLSSIALAPDGTLRIAQADIDSASVEDQATIHMLDGMSGQYLGNIQLPGVVAPSLFGGAMAISGEVAVIEHQDGLLAFETTSGAAVADLSRSQLSDGTIEDLALDDAGRLFILFSDPKRVAVFRAWEPLTFWWLGSEVGLPVLLPIKLALGSSGEVQIVDTTLSLLEFEP